VSEQVPSPVIPGVRWGRVPRFGDTRGAFRELWRTEWFPELTDPRAAERRDAGGFVQANLSSSAAGVLRGLHLHNRQIDYWFVANGRAFVTLVDVRPCIASPDAKPIVETRVLGPDENVTIPIGVAHGFLAIEPIDLIYLVTNVYDGSDELGFAWDDPAVAIPWPTDLPTPDGRPILSGRDSSNPSLAELVASIRNLPWPSL
jgi:dTDP-4-dehydrorhamnose 3,5-epimerase